MDFRYFRRKRRYCRCVFFNELSMIISMCVLTWMSSPTKLESSSAAWSRPIVECTHSWRNDIAKCHIKCILIFTQTWDIFSSGSKLLRVFICWDPSLVNIYLQIWHKPRKLHINKRKYMHNVVVVGWIQENHCRNREIDLKWISLCIHSEYIFDCVKKKWRIQMTFSFPNIN